MVRGSESLGERRLAPDPIHGGDGEYAEIQFETQDDANAAVERFNEVLKKAMLDTGSSRSAISTRALVSSG